jgi:glyoxylase-like metal-dependent hydrolase (beta-lactamase superfamily II)/predicted ester cyclase
MAKAGEIATKIATSYFDALGRQDLDAATAVWKPGGVDRIVGDQELSAPDGIRRYFDELFAAFPDFALEILEVTASTGRAAVRWRAKATFAGPGYFQGFAPNHARIAIEGCDIVTVEDKLIVHNDAYIDSGDIARQLGLLPPTGSVAQQRLAKLANLRTRAAAGIHAGQAEAIADGVWLIRGGFPLRTMNVYLVQEPDGVTVFDAGIDGMAPAIVAAAARMGGIKRVVLSHADADHRGAAPALNAPVYCHQADRAAAQSDASLRSYFDLAKLRPYARPFYAKMLPAWDGGRVTIAGTVAEGDEVAGFRVVELPGHAPGLIGLFRESDRLALVSDTVYTLDVQTGRKGGPRIPHAAFDESTERAGASIRKLAELEPAVVWPGHADPVTGDVAGQLNDAAAALPA